MSEKKTRSGGAARGGKAAKDPNAPKRPLSAYMFFANDRRDSIKEEFPNATFGEVGKHLGEKWKKLSDSEKKPYNDKAAADKDRYAREMKDYGGADEKKKPASKKAKKDEE